MTGTSLFADQEREAELNKHGFLMMTIEAKQ
jgi:hypothetical protein